MPKETLYTRLNKEDKSLFKDFKVLKSMDNYSEIKLDDACNIFWEKYPSIPFDLSLFQDLFKS